MRRTPEIEEATNARFIHPVSAWLTGIFARWGVAPNAVSLTGMAGGLAAGFCYAHAASGRASPWAAGGLLLMLLWHVMDGADGQLARLTGRFSASGKVLDGICDYTTFIAVYVGLASAMSPRYGSWIWAFVAFSGLCHAAQSAAYELQRQEYDYWVHGRGTPPLERRRRNAGLGGWSGALHGLYARAQAMLSGRGAVLDAALERRLARFPSEEAGWRAAYRDTFAPIVRRWSVLCANYRTFAIFLFTVCGFPLGYFLFETVVLSLVLAGLMTGLRRVQEAFIRHLDTAGRRET